MDITTGAGQVEVATGLQGGALGNHAVAVGAAAGRFETNTGLGSHALHLLQPAIGLLCGLTVSRAIVFVTWNFNLRPITEDPSKIMRNSDPLGQSDKFILQCRLNISRRPAEET